VSGRNRRGSENGNAKPNRPFEFEFEFELLQSKMDFSGFSEADRMRMMAIIEQKQVRLI
jgi:hypothetical protein